MNTGLGPASQGLFRGKCNADRFCSEQAGHSPGRSDFFKVSREVKSCLQQACDLPAFWIRKSPSPQCVCRQQGSAFTSSAHFQKKKFVTVTREQID